VQCLGLSKVVDLHCYRCIGFNCFIKPKKSEFGEGRGPINRGQQTLEAGRLIAFFSKGATIPEAKRGSWTSQGSEVSWKRKTDQMQPRMAFDPSANLTEVTAPWI